MHGDRFSMQSSDLKCAFHDLLTEATFVSATRVDCIAPRWQGDGLAAVEVSMNAIDFTSDGQHLTFVDVILSSMTPANGPVHGATRILIRASKFPPGEHHCHFGHLRTVATRQSTNVLACFSPRLSSTPWSIRGGRTSLSTSVGHVLSLQGLQFQYDAPQANVGLVPIAGPHHGGTVVTIVSSSLSQRSVFCRFEAAGVTPAIVSAHWHSPSQLRCITPHFRPGAATLEITLNGQQYTKQQFMFSFYSPARIVHIVPLMAPPAGGSLITITTRSPRSLLSGRLQIFCEFNFTKTVQAQIGDAGRVRCIAPPHVPGTVTLRLTAGAGQTSGFGSSSNLFVYKMLGLIGISPSSGPRAGGTLLSLACDNLPNGATACFFAGRVQTEATVQASNSVACLSPPASESGSIVVSVLCDTAACSNSQRFEYHSDIIRPISISPARGPVRGGTRVEVYGVSRVYKVACKFGSHLSAPQVLAASTAGTQVHACTSPVGRSGSLPLLVSLNGQQFIEGAAFKYTRHLFIAKIFPARGPATVGAVMHFHVDHFQEDGTLLCKFEDADSTHLVPAEAGLGDIRCTVPAMATGYIAVSITTNGLDFSDPLPYEAVPSASGTEIPVVGIGGRGQSSINIVGRAFNAPLDICLFAGRHGIPARHDSASDLSCTFRTVGDPDFAESGVVHATNELVVAGPGNLNEMLPVIRTLSPTRGPRQGGTTLTMQVDNVGQSSMSVLGMNLFCRFGGRVLVPAMQSISRHVECVTPTLESALCPVRCQASRHSYCRSCPSSGVMADVYVGITVTVNGQQFSEAELFSFEYHPDVAVFRCA